MDGENTTETSSCEDELRIYFVVNADLNMGVGKTAAQTAHAMQYLLSKREELLTACDTRWILDERDAFKKMIGQALCFNQWLYSPAHCKIALGANTQDFNSIKDTYADRCVVVRDAGRTEVASGSETVIGLYPMRKDERCALLKRLRLL